MIGVLAKERPRDPSTWRVVHEKIAEKRTKFEEMENGKLFSTIHTSLCDLPRTQQEQLRLMAVMASGAVATKEMLANLWSQVCLISNFRPKNTFNEWECGLVIVHAFKPSMA